MAIKVSGTSVIDDSRNLQNIASIDATTEAAITSAGFTKTTGDITGVTAGAGMTGGGTSGTVTISHADTSSRSSVNNSGNTVIQDIYLDTYGHVTAINSKTISASPPTSAGAVGTYAFVNRYSGDMDFGATVAGSQIRPCYVTTRANNSYGNGSEYAVYSASTYGTLSGTWRLMSDADAQGTKTYMFLAVRIS